MVKTNYFAMMQAFWVVIGILLITIFYFVYRMYSLANRYKTKKKARRFSFLASNNTSAYLLLGFAILFIGGFWVYFFIARTELLPESATVQGEEIDELFYTALWAILVPFTIFNFLLFYTAYKFRHRKGTFAHFYPKNIKIEIAWTTITAAVLIVLIWWGSGIWTTLTSKAPDDAEIINVMGYQFAWGLRYPGEDNKLGSRDYQLINPTNDFGLDLNDPNTYDDFTPVQMHVPVGKPVQLQIIARDVIHSVYIPHFRLKMDAVPGMPTRMWFTPKFTTREMRVMTNNPDFDYELACAEVCGASHYAMKMIVVVDSPQDYEEWKNSQTSWLKQHPEYLEQVPEKLREVAKIKSGIKENEFLVAK